MQITIGVEWIKVKEVAHSMSHSTITSAASELEPNEFIAVLNRVMMKMMKNREKCESES